MTDATYKLWAKIRYTRYLKSINLKRSTPFRETTLVTNTRRSRPLDSSGIHVELSSCLSIRLVPRHLHISATVK
jgi:hypothetical protein